MTRTLLILHYMHGTTRTLLILHYMHGTTRVHRSGSIQGADYIAIQIKGYESRGTLIV